MEDWNPAGVGGLPEDEYDSYVWPVLGLLKESAEREALLARLRQIELDFFGRAVSDDHLAPVVDKLMALGLGKREGTAK